MKKFRLFLAKGFCCFFPPVFPGFSRPDFDGLSGANLCFRLEQMVVITNPGGEVKKIQGEIPVLSWQEPPYYQAVEKVSAVPAVHWHASGRWAEISSGPVPAGGRLEYRFTYLLTYKDGVMTDPPNCQAQPHEFRDMERYLQAEEGIEVGDPMLTAVVSRQVARLATPKEKARRLFAYVNEKLTYRVDFSRKASAVTALKSGWGRCEDFALLYVALCRTAGVPARVVYGFRLDRKELKPGQRIPLNNSHHAWVEVFLPGTGWIPVEPTFLAEQNGRKIVDYRSFGGFYSGDIHLFMAYNKGSITLKYYSAGEGNSRLRRIIN